MSLATRTFCSLVHRWSGLGLAVFLVVAGVGGAVISFYDELDVWLNPHLHSVQPRATAHSVFELRERVERLFPNAQVDSVPLHVAPGRSIVFELEPRVDPVSGAVRPLQASQVFVDPHTGEVLGSRLWGALRVDSEHILPLVYRLHYEMMIPEPWGRLLFGATALIWVVNCLIGLYLTMPRARARFLVNWKRAWQVQWTRSVQRLSFDLHRTVGLWTLPLFLVFAVSAVYLNLYYELFEPALRSVLTVERVEQFESKGEPIAGEPQVGWEEALRRGRQLMAERAREQTFTVHSEGSLDFYRASGFYVYAVRSSLDIAERDAETSLLLSARDGAELGFMHPRIASGNAVIGWLQALHTAQVWGMPFQVLVSGTGTALALVSVTGVVVWLKRRRKSPITPPKVARSLRLPLP
jgi:uncharacterized iron-regulated membrane protein